MYYDFTVPVPKVQGKITKQKKGESTYVSLETGREYKPEKRYTVAQRVTIGKLAAGKSNEMYPNEKFEDYFPGIVFPGEKTDPERSCALRIGTYVVLQKMVKEYNLREMLEKCFGSDAGLLLDLIAFRVIHKHNSDIDYRDYTYCHPLFTEEMTIYTDEQVENKIRQISREQVQQFLDECGRGHASEQYNTDIDSLGNDTLLLKPGFWVVEMVSAFIRDRLNDGIKNSTKSIPLSTILGELERIEMGRRNSGVYRGVRPLSEIQINIFSSFGITEQYVRSCEADISASLLQWKKK